MRPLRLQVKGFTSFRDPCEIDFSGLELFAVVGPTGSGKSSLLDAITYALYGQVERVGKQVGQLVSQGQRRCAVTFEFAVGEERYRVARSTPASTGPTKVLLQRHDGTDYVQTGEGADRVREVNAMVERAIGLDYRAFTRSVLLPQGRFSEFLVGEAKERRKILTELLGLELFERLARRAGEIRKRAGIEADTKEELISTQFAGASPEAVADAEARAEQVEALSRSLAEAEERVADLATRGSAAHAEAEELRSCAEDARALERVARVASDRLGVLAAEEAQVASALAAADSDLAEALAAAERAAAALAAAEGEWGTEADVAAARARAESLAERRAALAATERDLQRAGGTLPSLAAALAAAEAEADAAKAVDDLAEGQVAAAREAVDRAQHADLVAAVRAGVHVGEPCPVCGAAVEQLPVPGPGGTDLEDARRLLREAEETLSAAATGLREAERRRDGAVKELEVAEREVARGREDLSRQREDLEGEERTLASLAGVDEDEDPGSVLDERLTRLRGLLAAGRTAAEAASAAGRAHREAERARDALAVRIGAARAALAGQPVSGLVRRAARLAGEGPALPTPSLEDLPEEPAAAAAAAVSAAAAAASLAEALVGLGERRSAAVHELLAEAERAVEGLGVRSPGTLEELTAAAAEAARAAAVSSATLSKEAEEARTRLAAVRTLEAEVAELRARVARFGALALELRADRIMEFLQLEALQVLASDGSERLRTLSEGRYLLVYEDDEFYVVDTWNGEERRSARTLSGGETFLASLALALALSEQVRSIAVTDKAALDSLFLDEGFGTLDPESLEVVIGAIEQLGGSGRMIGVITHVLELALRLPVRIEVEKSPRGSHLRVVA